MKFLSDLSLRGKRVLYRVDINSSIVAGEIADDTRIRAIVPTLMTMLEAGAKQVIVLAHQGRGKERTAETVLDLHAVRLGELMQLKVKKYDACRGVSIDENERLIMLENVRLDDEADENIVKRKEFAKDLAEYGDVYVNDAFATCHRDHATIAELPKLMAEKAAGLLLQKELEALQPLLDGDVEHPFTMIVAGAKVDTKIGVIEQFYDIADNVLLGGGIANTFLAAEGFDVGASLKEDDKLELAREIALELDKRGKELHVPHDVVCADEIVEGANAIDIPAENVMGDMKILDIGRQTADDFAKIIKGSKTVIWNGPVGLAEFAVFRKGSEVIARAMVECGGKTVVGGGESVGVINTLGISHDNFSHVSTGGGAMLEFLSGEELPGVSALR